MGFMLSTGHDLDFALRRIREVSGAEMAAWLREALSLGGDPDEVVEVLVRAGHPPMAAAAAVALAVQGVYLAAAPPDHARPRTALHEFTAPPHATAVPTVLPDGTPLRRVISMASPELVVYERLLSDAECDHLIAHAEGRLVRSYVGGSEQSMESEVRTSYGMFYRRGETTVLAAIEARLAALSGTRVDQGEGMQVLRYQGPQRYLPHFDFFEPVTEKARADLSASGNRIGTFLLYLRDVEEGGATYFPQIDLAIHPRRGQAVWFAYPERDGTHDQRTEHAGLPVARGTKWLATKWLRARPFADTGTDRLPAQPASVAAVSEEWRTVPRWQDILRRHALPPTLHEPTKDTA